MQFEQVDTTLPGITCDYYTPEHIVKCIIEALNPGEAQAFIIQVTPLATATQPGTQIFNYAEAWSIENDPGNANNYAGLWTTLTDVELTTPQVYSVTPESAVIPVTGKLIHIEGANFTLGMEAYLGDYALNNVTRLSNRRLVASVPNTIPAGTYDLRVVNNNNESGRLLRAFTILEEATPLPTQVWPHRGLSGIPVNIAIFGENFSSETQASLYDGSTFYPIEGVLFVQQSLLRGTIPRTLPPGSYALKLSDSRGDSWLPNAYTALDAASYDDLFGFPYLDLWMQPPSIQHGQALTVGVNIRREGGQTTLTSVAVDYYNGPPGASTYLGRSTAPNLEPRSLETATLTWTVGLPPGAHTLYAQIDPDNLIPESDEGNNLISRTVRVLPANPNYTPLTINSFSINQGAAFTTRPQVQLNVAAAPNPVYILYIEYQYQQGINGWAAVARSEWLPFAQASANYPWRLQPTAGVHYLQAWVADRNGNVGPHPAMAAINLLPAEAHVAEQEVHIFRYNLQLEFNYLVRITALSGDVDLYVWDPNGASVLFSEIDQPFEELIFSVTQPGVYQIEVEGYTNADYRIEIIPLNSGGRQPQSEPAPHMPNPRGRGTGISNTQPGENTGLPEIPLASGVIYLPLALR